MGEEKLNNSHRVNRHLVCDNEVFERITKDCVREYLRHHPEMLGANITHHHILNQISKFYMEQG